MRFTSILFTILPTLVAAANDWSKPCTSNTCSYESGDGKNSAWSNLVINAATADVLSDITTAAGWEILNCDSKSTDPQDIRLVCVDESKGCSHLFQGGADNTIVRLPESCAGGPFARVVRDWIDQDQTLPARLAKRGQTTGQVRGLALDFDFAKIPESKGKVWITAAATTAPGQRDALRPAVVKRSLQPIRHANRRAQAAAVVREFTSAPVFLEPLPIRKRFGFGSIGNAFKKVKDKVVKAKDKVVKTVKAAPKKAKEAVKKVVQKAKAAPKKVKEAVKKVVQKAKAAPKKIIKAVKAAPKKIVKAVKKVAKKTKQAAKKVKEVIKAAPKKAKEVAKKVVNKAKETAKKVAKKTKVVAKKVVDKTKKVAKKVADKTKEVAKKVVDKTKEVAKKVADKTKDVAKKVAKETDKVVDKVVDKVEDGVEFAGDVLEEGKDKLVDGAKKGADFVDDLVDGAVDGLKKGADIAEDFLGDAFDGTKKGVSAVGDKLADIVDTSSGAVEDFVGAVGDATDFDKKFSKDFNLININKNFPILDQSINCPQQGKTPAFEAGLNINVDVAAQMTANVGFIVTGTIVPPNIDKLAFTGGLTGEVSATFNVNANAKGTFESPDLKIFEIGLPGLDFPGILAVGPSFSVNANARAELGVVADISVGASLSLPEMQFTFPRSEGDSSADVNPLDSPVKLDVGASVELTGRAEAHLIPRLDIGVTILNGAAKATVFANIDASAGLDFTLDASASATPVDGTVGDTKLDFKNIDTSFGGSVGMDVGVSINVGAEAALEPFFNTGANFELFQKTFPLFEKKFGDKARKRSLLTLDERVFKRALTCPAAGEGSPQNGVVDATAQGA